MFKCFDRFKFTMKEIGSEFWDIPVCEKENDLFPDNTRWFLSGRHALEYIIIDSEIKSISMPRWCCESMIHPFIKQNVYVDYYDDEPNYSFDSVLILDYFGFTNHRLSIPNDYKGIIIRDLTQSLFSKKYDDADYYFGSLRKWAGFYTGGYAWGRWKKNISIPPYNKKYVDKRQKAMLLKKEFIESGKGNKGYLKIFQEANNMLNYLDISSSCPEDIIRSKHLDVDFIKDRRKKNAQLLINGLHMDIQINEHDVPLFIPIFIKNRNELREYLICHKIYCPVHWPNYDVNGTELSLICDQRYTEKDMMIIIELIKKFETKSR